MMATNCKSSTLEKSHADEEVGVEAHEGTAGPGVSSTTTESLRPKIKKNTGSSFLVFQKF